MIRLLHFDDRDAVPTFRRARVMDFRRFEFVSTMPRAPPIDMSAPSTLRYALVAALAALAAANAGTSPRVDAAAAAAASISTSSRRDEYAARYAHVPARKAAAAAAAAAAAEALKNPREVVPPAPRRRGVRRLQPGLEEVAEKINETVVVDDETTQKDIVLQFEACSFSSYLSFDNSVCGDGALQYYAPPSEVSACTSSIRLDPDNATQYVQSLLNLTMDNYIFRDVAVDPLLSDPDETLLDYPIYNGTGQGQVDLYGEMSALIRDVSANGATLELFHRVNAAYAQLNDGHVSINKGLNSAGMLDDYTVRVVSGEVVNGGAASVYLYVAYPAAGDEFVLMANVTSGSQSKMKRISSINGMEPLGFYTSLSSRNPFYGNYKSLGPRVQQAIQFLTAPAGPFLGSMQAGPAGTNIFSLMSAANPADLLDDVYDVVYEDGTATQWYSYQVVPCPVSRNMTTDEIEASLTVPGDLYSNFQDAAFEVFGDEIRIGVAVLGDYAVLKIPDGFEWEPRDMLDAWDALTAEAAAKNVTRLIVDIIANGGGDPNLAYQLAQLLYPYARWEDFANSYDMLYSPSLDVYLNDVNPLLNELSALANDPDSIENSTQILNQDIDILTEKLNRTVALYYALFDVYPVLSVVEAADAVAYILENVRSRVPPSILDIEVALLLEQILQVESSQSSPYQASDFFSLSESEYWVERVRGGIAGNYTTRFFFYDPRAFIMWQQQLLRLDHPFQFKQYLLIADGNGVGSSTSTFQTTVSQYAKFNQGVVAPLDTVSFGGSGNKDDAAVTQFAGGFIGDVDLTVLYVPFFTLAVMSILLEGTDFESDLLQVLFKYDDAIEDPCYFCNNSPQFPISEIYSVLTGANSTPLEYTNQRPDQYIKQWPTKTSFEDGSHLPDLYERTSAFFDQQTDTVDTSINPNPGEDDQTSSGSNNAGNDITESPSSSNEGSNDQDSADDSSIGNVSISFPMLLSLMFSFWIW